MQAGFEPYSLFTAVWPEADHYASLSLSVLSRPCLPQGVKNKWGIHGHLIGPGLGGGEMLWRWKDCTGEAALPSARGRRQARPEPLAVSPAALLLCLHSTGMASSPD